MPRKVRFSNTQLPRALKKGKFHLNTGDFDPGPTSESGFYAGIDPPSGGYTIYIDKASNGPSIYVLSNDNELITFTNGLAGTSYTTVAQCLSYYLTQDDKECVNGKMGDVITEGLTLYVNNFNPSYPRTGSDWFDISGNGNDVVLVNGVAYGTSDPNRFNTTTNLNYLQNYTSASFPYVSSTNGYSLNQNLNGYFVDKGNVWGETDPCSGLKTFEQALEYVHDMGARLPTLAELQAQLTRGTGCGYDSQYTWTIDKANVDGTERIVAYGATGSPSQSLHITGSAYVRFVADDNLERVDPITVTDDSVLYNYLTSNYIFEETRANVTESIKSFLFDGTDDYAYIKNLNYGGGSTISELTILVWMKTIIIGSNTGDGSVESSQWAFLDFDRSEVFNFYIEPGGQLKFSGYSSNSGGLPQYYDIGAGTGTLFNDFDYHLVGITFSVANQEIKFYGDGQLLRTITANGSMTALGAGLTRYGFIGDGSEAESENSSRNQNYYQGNIGAIMFYDDKVLTLEEIQNIYNSQVSNYS